MNGAASERLAAAWQRAEDTRAQARQRHAHTSRVAEAVAATQDRVAAVMERLAEARPQEAARLQELSGQARQQAERERQRAHGYARAAAAGTTHLPARRAGGPRIPGRPTATVAQVTLWELLDGFGQGMVLIDGQGIIMQASARLEKMFGYDRGELAGCPVEVLVPPAQRMVHRRLRSECIGSLRPRHSDDRAPLSGLHKDGTVFPVGISLSAVRSALGPRILALVSRTAEPALTLDPANAEAPAPGPGRCREELALLDRVITGLFTTGLRLQTRGSIDDGESQDRAALLDVLDGMIRDIRDHVFDAHGNGAGHAG